MQKGFVRLSPNSPVRISDPGFLSNSAALEYACKIQYANMRFQQEREFQQWLEMNRRVEKALNEANFEPVKPRKCHYWQCHNEIKHRPHRALP